MNPAGSLHSQSWRRLTKKLALNLTAQKLLSKTNIKEVTACKNWLKHNVGHYIPLEDWPPILPDLSLTENAWSIITAAAYTNTDGT